MTKKAHRYGLLLAGCDRKKINPLLLRIFKSLVPAHRKILTYLRRFPANAFKEEMLKSTLQDYENISTSELFRVMNEYWWYRNRFSFSWCDFVFAGTIPRCRFLNDIDIPAGYIPAGYHRRWGKNLQIKRDIDVLFIGRLKQTCRARLLECIQKKLASRGINIVTVTQDCYTEQRTGLLNRTKIVLDLVRIPWEMPIMRLLMSMGCGAMVVSNWTGEPRPFSNEHFVQAELDKIPETIEYYLKNEDKRVAVADSAYRFITEKLTMRNSILQILEQSGIKDIRAC